MFYLNDPIWLVLLLGLPIIMLVASRRRKPLGNPSIKLHKNIRSISWTGLVQALCFYSALVAFIIALAQPTMYQTVEKPAIQARDFVLLIDTSDSMEWGMIDPTIADGLEGDDKPSILTNRRKKNIVKRIHAAEASLQEFLKQRKGDRVGFVIFDKQAYYGWPLTDDLNVIKRFISGLPEYVGAGTEFDGEKGAIQAALNHLQEKGQSKTQVIVMVTDGEGNIAEERIVAISNTLKKRQVKLYVIGVGYKEWSEVPETEDLRNLTSLAGGQVIEVLDVEQMRNAFEEINKLEKSTVIKESQIEQSDIAYLFMIFGLFTLGIFAFFTVLNQDEL